MSIQAMSWVMAHSEARLGDRLVLLAIANHANAAGTSAWPSINTIAEETRMSTRQVKRAVQYLHDIGELVIEPEAGPSGVHRYCIAMGDRMSPPSDRMSPPASDNMSPGGDKSGTEGGQDVTQTVLEPSVKKEKKDSRSASASLNDRAFEDFWQECPKKVGKGAARTAWLKARQIGVSTDALLAGMKRFAALQAGAESRFIAHPSTWLNQQRWLDEEPNIAGPSRPTGPPPIIEDEHGNRINPLDGSIVSEPGPLPNDTEAAAGQRVFSIH